MGNVHRDRLSVDANGPWRLYATAIPRGSLVLGTVTRGHSTGALLQTAVGVLVMFNAGLISGLDQRKARAALLASRVERGSEPGEDLAPVGSEARPRDRG